MRNVLLIIVLGLFFLQNVSAQKKPGWLKNPEKQFSPEKFAYAIGDGENRTEARKAVFSVLSENISADIATKKELSKVETEQTVNGTYSSNISETFASSSELSSNNMLVGVDFEYYKDKKGTTHAIGYFNKKSVADLCNQKIDEFYKQIGELQRIEDHKLGTIGNLEKAKSLAINLIKFFDLLFYIDSDLAMTKVVIYPENIDTEIAKLKKEIRFGINPDMEDIQLKEQLVIFLNAVDYEVVDTDIDYIIEGQMEFLDSDRYEKFKATNWKLKLYLKKDEKTIGSFADSGWEDHVTFQQAHDKAYRKLGEALTSNKNSVKNKLFGISE